MVKRKIFPTWDDIVPHHEGFFGIVEPKRKTRKDSQKSYSSNH